MDGHNNAKDNLFAALHKQDKIFSTVACRSPTMTGYGRHKNLNPKMTFLSGTKFVTKITSDVAKK